MKPSHAIAGAAAAFTLLAAGCGNSNGDRLPDDDQKFVDALPSFWGGVPDEDAVQLGHDLCGDLDDGMSRSQIIRMMAVSDIPAGARSRTVDAAIIHYCAEYF